MPEPFKELFNVEVIAAIGGHLARAGSARGHDFDEVAFRREAGRGLADLELKERSRRIEEALRRYLPGDFAEAGAVILGALGSPLDGGGAVLAPDAKGLRGMALMPVADWVAAHGQDHLALSMHILKEITRRFTAEFAVRPFLVAQEEATLAILASWATDPDPHVRRLVSEGTRPRLPWATQLPRFAADPTPILPLLETLKDDPDEYVRRSVANNLNDIAKDHPDLVADVARRWRVGASPDRERLVRHACRTLVKQGHAGALAALGYGAPRVTLEAFVVSTPTVEMGGSLEFEVTLRSNAGTPQDLVVDYVIHHRKANGETRPKVFKWKVLKLAAGAPHRAKRTHRFKPITTRRYYGGRHGVEIQVNGQVVGAAGFELRV
jgi:3-methyladenine DNA glycosylase AlkC